MPSVSFQKCPCGVELKIMRLPIEHRQIYTCVCGREMEIIGSVTDMHSSVRTFGGKTEWVKVPLWKIKDAR